MKYRLVIFILWIPLLLTVGCKDDFVSVDERMITLGAYITSSIESRTDLEGNIDYDTHTGELEIGMIRWDESDADNACAGRPIKSATMGNPVAGDSWRRPVTFNPSEFYENRSDDVGFLGWYPQNSDNWVKEGNALIHRDNTMAYNIDGKTDVMFSDFIRGNFTDGMPQMSFKHALCLYKIYAYYVDEDAKQQWGNLKQVTFQNLPERLLVDLPNDLSSATPVRFTYSDESSTGYVERNLFDGEQDKELPTENSDLNATYMASILGGTPSIGVLGIKVFTSNERSGNSVSIARNFKPGYAYTIYLKLSSKGVINAEVSVGNWDYDGTDYMIEKNTSLLTDLSRYGTANCYVVSSANMGYCFNATIKGNGVNTLTKKDGTTITLPDKDVSLQVDHVDILRTDAMMKLVDGRMVLITDMQERGKIEMVRLISHKLSNGKVMFEVPGDQTNAKNYALQYKGNVKIAAYNRAGEIIWSWHIWITDKPMNQGYSNGSVAMDRNLGAVTAGWEGFQIGRTAWSGLYYQWGRKDPLFRGTIDPSYANIWGTNVKAYQVSVADAHKNPTAYFYSPGSNNWTTDEATSDHFWGYISDRDNYVKTIYDPCPPGYRVSSNAIWEVRADNFTLTSVAWNGNNAGYKIMIGDYTQVYYPGTSCVINGKIELEDADSHNLYGDNYVYQYSATPYIPVKGQGDEYKGRAYHFRYDEKEAADNPVYSSLVYETAYNTQRSTAFPVRCVYEESAPVIHDLSGMQTANSYIVSRSGYYKFKANIRGNGVTKLNVVMDETGIAEVLNFDGGLGAEISSIDKADVLWWQGDLSDNSTFKRFLNNVNMDSQTLIQNTCPVRILDNGSVYGDEVIFYATVNENTKGNVGIAVYDSNGTILWTWHIWLVPDGVKNKRLGDYAMMDRNLGATYAPASASDVTAANVLSTYGFFYQWGRKDPMFGPKAYNNLSERSEWFEKRNGTWTKKSSLQTQVETSIKDSPRYPLYYLTTNNSHWWQTTYADADFNSKKRMRNLWGYTSEQNKEGNAYAKTMWDPCPPGYRVMNHLAFFSANICDAVNDGTYSITGSGVNGWGILLNESQKTNLGSIKADRVWFPFSGKTDSDGNFITGGRYGEIFSVTPNEGGYYARSFRIDNSSFAQQQIESSMKESKPVRCVME